MTELFSSSIERSVLAIIMDGRHQSAMSIARERLAHPLCFYKASHRIIYQAMLDLDSEMKNPDMVTVSEVLRRDKSSVVVQRIKERQKLEESDLLGGLTKAQLDAFYKHRPEDNAQSEEDSALGFIGGLTELADICSTYPGFPLLKQHCSMLLDLYAKRRAVFQLNRLRSMVETENLSVENVVENLLSTATSISGNTSAENIIDTPTAIESAAEDLDARLSGGKKQVKSGVTGLDELLQMHGGGLYILAARPGCGKTSVACNIARESAMSGGDVLVLSLEVPISHWIHKVNCIGSSFPYERIEKCLLTPEDLVRIKESMNGLHGFHLCDRKDVTASLFRTLVQRWMQIAKNPRLIVLDYLQLLSSGSRNQDEYAKISEATRILKIAAMESGVPILALSQMNREIESHTQKDGAKRRPRLSDLRGSGSIEQDADAVLFLSRETSPMEAAPPLRESIDIILAKNRYGRTGTVPIVIDWSCGKIIDGIGSGSIDPTTV